MNFYECSLLLEAYDDGFLNSIIENPLDSANYLVYADYLDNEVSTLIRYAFKQHDDSPGKEAHNYQKLRDSIADKLKQKGWYFRWSAHAAAQIQPEDYGKDIDLNTSQGVVYLQVYQLQDTVLRHHIRHAKDKIIRDIRHTKDETIKLVILLLYIDQIFTASWDADRSEIVYNEPETNLIIFNLRSLLRGFNFILEMMNTYGNQLSATYDIEVINNMLDFSKRLTKSKNTTVQYLLGCIENLLNSILLRLKTSGNCSLPRGSYANGNINYCNKIKEILKNISK